MPPHRHAPAHTELPEAGSPGRGCQGVAMGSCSEPPDRAETWKGTGEGLRKAEVQEGWPVVQKVISKGFRKIRKGVGSQGPAQF